MTQANDTNYTTAQFITKQAAHASRIKITINQHCLTMIIIQYLDK